MLWLLLGTGLGGGVCLATGHFGAAAVLAAWAVWECGRQGPVRRPQRSLGICLVEFFLLAGLVFFYRESVKLQCLALFALLGAFVEAHICATMQSLPQSRGIDRVRLLALCAWFATVTEWFWEGRDPVMGHPVAYPVVAGLAVTSLMSHLASAGAVGKLVGALRRRRRTAWARAPRLALRP